MVNRMALPHPGPLPAGEGSRERENRARICCVRFQKIADAARNYLTPSPLAGNCLRVKSLIRMATQQDAAAIRDIYSPYCEHTPITFEEVTPSLEDMQGRIHKVIAQYPWLVCECDGAVAGYAYGSTHRERAAYRWTVEVGVYVAQDRHRS